MHFTKYDWGGSTPIILGKMHFLLISENEFTHGIKCNGMTSFIEFTWSSSFKRSIKEFAGTKRKLLASDVDVTERMYENEAEEMRGRGRGRWKGKMEMADGDGWMERPCV